MSRAAWLNCQHERSCALVLTLFLFQKGQGFFPTLPIAALLPRSWRGATLPPCGLGCFGVTGKFCGMDEWADFHFPCRRRADAPLAAWVFWQHKSPACFFKTSWTLKASHEACRRMAVCTGQRTGNHIRPASREACRRAAVASQPSCMSPEQPRALWARCGVQGVTPCQTREPRGLSPSGGSFAAKPHVPRAALRAQGAQSGVQGYYPCRPFSWRSMFSTTMS